MFKFNIQEQLKAREDAKKEKELIEKIITTSKCRVTPEDIYTNTDFFDKPRYTKKVNPFKLAFLVSVVFLFNIISTY